MPHRPDQGLRRGEVSEGVQYKMVALAQSCTLRKKQAEFCPEKSVSGTRVSRAAWLGEIRLE
jgi:hypothetical protein